MKRLIVLFLAVLGIGAMAPTMMGQQEHKNPARGIQSGASYAISDIESINTTNGNLSLNIPLATLPKGRGETGQAISLRYNSKLYDTSVEEMLDFSGQLKDQNMLVHSPDGGWSYAINTYTLDLTSRFEGAPGYQCGTGVDGKMSYVWKVAMLMPDGSRREFRPSGYTDNYSDGFFQINPNGYLTNGCSIPSTALATSAGVTYYSTDGSYSRLVVSHVSGSQNNGEFNAWTMSMPDGSRVTGGGGNPVRLYDRNGNYLDGTTDIFGRSISIQYNAAQDEDHVTMRGVNNAELKWIVKWKNITVSKSYTTTGANSGRTRGGTSDQSVAEEFRVVDRITLPSEADSLYYEFDYNSEPGGANGWGEISRIKMPSGATADYEFFTPLPVDTGRVLRNYVKKKTLTWLAEYDGGSSPVSDVTNYSVSPSSTTITNPDGSTSTESFGETTYENQMSGIVYRTVSSNGNRTERLWGFNLPTGANATARINPYVKTEYTTIADSSGAPSLTAIKDVTIDPNGNQAEVREYDWVAYSSIPKDGNGFPTAIPGGAVLKRKTVSTFNNSASSDSTKAYWTATAPNVRNAVASTEVRDGSNNPASRTEFTYDNAATTANVTTTKSWDSWKDGVSRAYTNPLTSTNSISTAASYNTYGMPMTTTDAKGIVSTITYGPVNGYSDLYPTQTVTASNYSAVKRTTNIGYDFYTGLPTTVTDADNSNATTTTVYDPLGRPLTVTNPLGARTTTDYYDAQRYVVVKGDIENISDGREVAIQHFDQLGRVRLVRTLESPGIENPSNETHGIKVQTRYQTSAGYSYSVASNPYRAAYSSGASAETTMAWTRTKVVNHGRQSLTETFSGATLPAPWGSNNSSTGIVSTDLDANRTLVTDQAGKRRISKTNGIGQMTDVWEVKAYDSNDTALVGVSFPGTAIGHGYQTSYAYDSLDNLTTVTQGGQSRSFTYSSLSRLRTATNPEMGTTPTNGTVTYSYDPNGNLTGKLDARSITTTYVYDELNRIKQRSYNDSPQTPAVVYTYDQYTNSKGRLTKVASTVSTTEYTAFDILGKVTQSKQTTDGVTYGNGSSDSLMTYKYNLAGALTEQQYPSGRVVKNVVESDGDLSLVQSRKNANSGYWNYANSFSYNAAGAVTSMHLGNGKWESTAFNARLQPEQIALGTIQNGTDKLKLNYTYGGSQNNGNVITQTITVPGLAQPFVQTYAYDELNRLSSAAETSNGATWNQAFGYDRYGNRNITSGAGLTNFTFNRNRITAHSYDNAGNTISDGAGKTFTYDAENKQTAVNNGSTGEYGYDGVGRRVKKYGDGLTTVFVYDALGKLVAEYSTSVATGPSAKVAYLTNDQLGSPRINTDENGAVTSRQDYRPFGEEILTAQRSVMLGYTADTSRKKFTGYERDNESSLDFAQSRYYGPSQGRFTSPDIPFAEQIEEEPQSWNLYVYVGNNPLKYRDPLGLWKEVACVSGGQDVKCYESDSEDDTYESLAALIGTSPGLLGEFFSNQEITPGKVFGTEGYYEWLSESKDRLVDHITFKYPAEPPMAGGIGRAGKGLFSRLWNGAKKFLGVGGKSAAQTSRAADYAQYQKLKQLYRKLMSKPPATDAELRSIMDDLYRANAQVGSGSTAAAVREEIKTGQPVGGRWHTQKAQEGIRRLEKWLSNNPSASPSDRHAAQQVILDMKEALGL